MIARVRELFRQGWTPADISRHLDINRRRVDNWVRLEALPERFKCDPKPTSLMRFHALLQELMRAAVTKIRWLFVEAKKLKVKDSPAPQGRNPATGEIIEIAASRKLGFTPAKQVKDAIAS